MRLPCATRAEIVVFDHLSRLASLLLDDVHDIAQLLNLSDGATLRLLNELDT